MQRLDSELLRTFLAVTAAGSVTAAAQTIGRSQSATSVQIKQLEETAGVALLRRHGRGVVLTPAGETLLPVARQVVALLDQGLAQLQSRSLSGRLRIGIPDDQSKGELSAILADFGRSHPQIALTVDCALSSGFPKALTAGELDLAVHEVAAVLPGMQVLRRNALHWVCRPDLEPERLDTLPVALFDRDCWWRDLALESLRKGGRSYRVVYSSESASGILAAVEAGMALAVLSNKDLPPGVAALRGAAAPGPLPRSTLVLQYGRDGRSEPARAMGAAITRAFQAAG
ncbi:MAG: LysR substrate-binding domain-containing protein [Pseudomonadota bacterium]